MTRKHLIVIGGGAAGFFCAVNAARRQPDLRVTILEKSGKLLSKVKISGGGRCNVTHACFSNAEMVRNYPRGQKFLKPAFKHFFTDDTINWFKTRGVALKTEDDGRMFPVTDSSDTIINCLLNEANTYGVSVHLNKAVKRIMAAGDRPGVKRFEVKLADGSSLPADFVCVACGGFSKTEQYHWLDNLGHTIVAPVPSLFTFNIPQNPIRALMGVSVSSAKIKIRGASYQYSGPLLITHWGMSGPAVLKLSAYAARELASMNYDFWLTVGWTGDANENSMLERLKTWRREHSGKKIRNQNLVDLPRRLWEYLLQEAGINPDWNWADLPAKPQNLLAKVICTHEFHVQGKTTFKEEFVTAGGISLERISPDTMESGEIKGLYFAGKSWMWTASPAALISNMRGRADLLPRSQSPQQ